MRLLDPTVNRCCIYCFGLGFSLQLQLYFRLDSLLPSHSGLRLWMLRSKRPI